MKKLRFILAFIAVGIVLNSCSKDDNESTPTPTPTPTALSNGALVNGVAATSTETPAMSDKTAILKTTAGTFELEFASKPTESGTYTVKSSLAAKDASTAAKVAAALNVVTFKFIDKDNFTYIASDNAGGTVSIIIKDGKISIDVSNVSVCYMDTCKQVSVKYDFSYTPPVVNPNPNPNPNPTTGTAGAGYVDGVASTSTTGTGMWVNNAIVFNTPTGSFQVWFKEKPTAASTYSVKGHMSLILGNTGVSDVSFAYVPTGGGSQYWSTDTSGGSVVVKNDGVNWIIEAKDINACVNATNDCKTFSAYYKVSK